MPTTEYYDRGMPEERLVPANRVLQDEYWLLRSVLCAALRANWTEILEACPEVAEAATSLEAFMHRHPTRTFSVFSPRRGTDGEAGGRLLDGLLLRRTKYQ